MKSLDFSQNYFELFGLNPDFNLDAERLKARQQQLLATCHPDRFVNASDREKRLSVQMASWVNQANETLRDPVKRAAYLLQVSGVEAGDESETTSDTGFLMEQIELREEIEACRSGDDALHCCDQISLKLDHRASQLAQEFVSNFAASDLEAARQSGRKMQFIQRIQQQLSDLQFELEDN
jgi:molecular chaperone HscB